MSNKLNTEAVTTNMENILETTLGYYLEDLSVDPEPKADKPLAIIMIQDIDFMENTGEAVKGYKIAYILNIRFIEEDVATARDSATNIIWSIREAIRVGKVNVGAVLGVSKLVNWTRHGRPLIEYGENGVIEVNYPITVEVIEERI